MHKLRNDTEIKNNKSFLNIGDYLNYEALPGVLGNRGTRAIFIRGTEEQRPKNKGNREHRQFSGTANIENQDFVFGEQGHLF